MTVNGYYTNLIESSKQFIENKDDENQSLEAQESKEKGFLKTYKEKIYSLKRQMNSLRDEMNYFLRKNGGIFNLNEEQQIYYASLLEKKGYLSDNIFSIGKLTSQSISTITSLKNRQFSNHLAIFQTSCDLADYTNQQNLYSNISAT